MHICERDCGSSVMNCTRSETPSALHVSGVFHYWLPRPPDCRFINRRSDPSRWWIDPRLLLSHATLSLFVQCCQHTHMQFTFAEYNQHDGTFHNLFISVRRCTCFRTVFPPIITSSNMHILKNKIVCTQNEKNYKFICLLVIFHFTYNSIYHHHHHHHHHMSVMGLGHMLTRSGLTYLEVSSEVCHDSFCQLG